MDRTGMPYSPLREICLIGQYIRTRMPATNLLYIATGRERLTYIFACHCLHNCAKAGNGVHSNRAERWNIIISIAMVVPVLQTLVHTRQSHNKTLLVVINSGTSWLTFLNLWRALLAGARLLSEPASLPHPSPSTAVNIYKGHALRQLKYVMLLLESVKLIVIQ